jgi:hypothetical protein
MQLLIPREATLLLILSASVVVKVDAVKES